jgi:serine O-acetyltransferase
MKSNFIYLIKQDLIRYADNDNYRRKYPKIKKKDILILFYKNFYRYGFQSIVCYRLYCLIYNFKPRFIFFPILFFLKNYPRIFFGVDIHHKAEIKGGFYIGHYQSIFIGENVKIGKDVNIMQDVTIGSRGGSHGTEDSPIIGNNVMICAGAKVLGKIIIGDNCIIGANSVVINSFSKNQTIVGIPGKSVKNNDGYQYNNNN